MTNINSNANNTLVLYTDVIKQASATWKSAYSATGLGDIDVESVYSSLVGEEVGTAYFPSLKKALAKAESSVLATIKTLESLVDEQNGVDNEWKNRNNGSDYNGSMNNNSGFNGDKGTETKTDTLLQPVQTELEVNEDFINKINDLSTEDYNKFMTALGSIQTEELLSYLVDSTKSSDLKKYLLEQVNISDDLRKIISEMDENELQLTLVSLLTDETYVSDISKSVIYNYTEELSKKSNLNPGDLSMYFFYNIDNFSNIVDNVIKVDDIQKVLLRLYEGNDVTNDTVSSEFNVTTGNDAEKNNVLGDQSEVTIAFIRSSIDEICKKHNTDYETLLTDSSKKDIVKEEFTDISKGLSYFKAVDALGTEASELLFKSFILKETSNGTENTN